MASHKDTLDDSNMLKLHEGRCRLAEQLRRESFRGLTWVDLLAIFAMLAEGSVRVPEKLMKQIMEKRVLHIMRTGGESRFADLFEHHDPLLVEGELVPTSPRVTDCACSIAGKVGLFQRLLFSKILVPAIMEGESSSDMVGRCVRKVVALVGTGGRRRPRRLQCGGQGRN